MFALVGFNGLMKIPGSRHSESVAKELGKQPACSGFYLASVAQAQTWQLGCQVTNIQSTPSAKLKGLPHQGGISA